MGVAKYITKSFSGGNPATTEFCRTLAPLKIDCTK